MRFSSTKDLLSLAIIASSATALPLLNHAPPHPLISSELSARATTPICEGNAPGTDGHYLALGTGIKYLSHHPPNSPSGQCEINVAGGPGQCVRVSCSGKTAISVCNDNMDAISVGCDQVAGWAQMISDECSYHPSLVSEMRVRGQVFVPGENWNVVVNGANCYMETDGRGTGHV